MAVTGFLGITLTAAVVSVQAVNDLKFSRDCTLLVSGGEDAAVSCWLLKDILDIEQITQLSYLQSFVTW